MEELEMLLLECEEHMDKAIEALKRELSTVRTGRANASLLDSISIEYYGVQTPLKQVSSISIPEANQLYIKPFDKSSLKDIEKAILASALGLTPQNDGAGVRLILPKMTEERRRELTKVVGKMEEAAKVAVRNVRRTYNDDIKKLGLPEDDEKGSLEDIQKLTDAKITQIEAIAKVKDHELCLSKSHFVIKSSIITVLYSNAGFLFFSWYNIKCDILYSRQPKFGRNIYEEENCYSNTITCDFITTCFR